MLSNIGQKIFSVKYAIDEDETWDDACLRVASYIASAEKEDERVKYTAKFFQAIHEQVFLPGGRVLANAGTPNKNLANCFVLPVEDSRKGIYSALNNAAEVFNRGGGVGYDFSKIRSKGSPINGIRGKASGPVAFMELFNQTGELIQQASRRGAQMGILSIEHKDIEGFVRRKTSLTKENKDILNMVAKNLGVSLANKYIHDIGYEDKHANEYRFLDILEKVLLDSQLTYFNVSVSIPDSYMEQNDKTILKLMAKSAWSSGDPGVFFVDAVNEDNMIPYEGRITATNPCGEVPLLPYESCVLGSINLSKFYDEERSRINFEFLEYIVRLSTRFLDNVQTLSESGIKEIDEFSKSTRRLGLGVMGWSDLLAMMELPYDSEEAFALAEYLSWFISYFAWSESMSLADERGSFSKLDLELADQTVLRKVINTDKSEIRLEKNVPVRNVAVTSIAPTGSIALLADINSSIEPFYALAYTRYRTGGVKNNVEDTYQEINSILFEKLKARGILNDELALIRDKIIETGSVQGVEGIPDDLKKVFKTAHEIDWKAHVDMQSAWQSFVSNSVSKTINLPNSATVEDIEKAFEYMWEVGLKGGTIYRDGSKSFQVLNHKK